jgi:hypothetical protein
MKKFIIVIIFIFIVPTILSQVQFNEVMSNPTDSNEWIEFFLFDDFNFSNTTLTDNYYQDEIVCCDFNINCSLFFFKDDYVLIFDQDTSFNISNIKKFLCVDDNSLGNGLGNKQDNLTLAKENIIINNYAYEIDTEKGDTISKINSSWFIAKPTPGTVNELHEQKQDSVGNVDLEVLLNINEKVFSNTEYKLFKLKNNNYPEHNNQINITFNVNISNENNLVFSETYFPQLKSYTTTKTGNFLFEDGVYFLCGKIESSSILDKNIENNQLCVHVTVINTKNISCNISLETQIVNDKIFENKNKIQFKHYLTNKSFPFIIEYWVEDLFGDKVKNKVQTSNLNTKSFTPKINEQDRVFFLKSKLNFLGCNNSNKNLYNEKVLLIKNNQVSTEDEESNELIENEIIILGTDKEEYFFGDVVMLEIYVKKGDSSKTVVSTQVKSKKIVSYTTKTYFKDKNTEYEIKFPVLLRSNCENKFKDGEYGIEIEGLGVIVSKNINIFTNRQKCNLIYDPLETVAKDKNKEFELIHFSNETSAIDPIFSIIRIFNDDNLTHNYTIHSYIYSGPKSYSGERTKNLQNFSLEPESYKLITLKNSYDEIPDKEVNLKIKLKKDTDKTQKEITLPLKMMKNDKSIIEDSLNPTKLVNEKPKDGNKITGGIIYESTSAKIKNYSFVFVVFIILLFIYLLFKDYL